MNVHYLQQTISKVQACRNFDTSKVPFPTISFTFRTKYFTLLLKIGMNDCKILKLNAVFKILRCGRQMCASKIRASVNKVH